MKKLLLFVVSAILIYPASAQIINTAYVKALYQQYPTQRTDFCPSCKLWINPYYKSIADTVKHAPVVTYYIYTKAHRLEQETADVPRTGIYAAWHPAYGQPDETGVYKEANRIIGKPNTMEVIAKGHCQAWILMAWTADAAILSDTYTFNAGMEFQGQNIGTEIATEELCRKLTGHEGPEITDSVKIWCGTYGAQRTYTKGDLTIAVPSHYYKIIKYLDHITNQVVTQCYWMPNQPTEKRAMLPERMVDHMVLVNNLGFDPQVIFKE